MRGDRQLSACVSSLALAMSSGLAQAQEVSGPTVVQDAPAGADAPIAAVAQEAASDIVVTGSRIASTGFSTPTPVTVVQAADLIASQPTTLAAALNNLPALVAQGGPAANSGSNGGGQNFLNLRNLGQTRTLVLLDGRRFVASTADSRVDTNLIPADLVARVDVITGGASAAYGSDAVAGVVNFVLDHSFTGLKGSVQRGISERGDNNEFRATLSAGTSFAEGRGHVMISGEWFDGGRVAGDARDFRVEGDNYLTIAGNNPLRVTTDKVRTTATYGGLIVTGVGGTAANNASFQGIQFGPGGSILPYDYGTFTQGRGTANGVQSGGDGVNTAVTQEIVRPLDRRTVFGRADFEATDSLKFFAEGSYGYSFTRYEVLTTANTGNFALRILPDNAFLPAALRAQMLARGVTSLTMTRYAGEGGPVLTDNRNKTWRTVAGFNADVDRFKVDGYYTHGENRNTAPIYNNQITANFNKAVDSVLNGAGQAVCRVNADAVTTNDDPACVAYNPFGAGSPSAGALGYVNGSTEYSSHNKQDVASLQVSGTLFEGWAGPIGIAVGGEYRHESVDVRVNAQSQAGAFRVGNAQAFSGRYTIKEAFGELNVPLLKDSAVGRSLDLNGAVRYADYSTGVSATTWKAGANYEPIEGLRFRVTRSRDIRAPNLNDLFSPGRQGTAVVIDPQNGNRSDGPFPTFPSGNINLRPEVSNALVAGVVVQPQFLREFNLAVDFYDFKVHDAIASIDAQQTLDYCAQGATFACAYISRDPVTQRITGIRTPLSNLNTLLVRGIDTELSYRFDLGSGKVVARGLLGYIDRYIEGVPGRPFINRSGEYHAPSARTPKWKGLASLNYTVGGFGLFTQMRYVGAGKWDVTYTAADADFNDIKAQAYFDVQLSQKVTRNGNEVEVFLNVQNLLDHQPPFVPFTGNANQTTQPELYDQVGRMFRFGVRAKF